MLNMRRRDFFADALSCRLFLAFVANLDEIYGLVLRHVIKLGSLPVDAILLF